MAIANTSASDSRAPSLPPLPLARASNMGLHPTTLMGSNELDSTSYCSGGLEPQSTTRVSSLDFNSMAIVRYSSSGVPPTPAPTTNTLSPPVEIGPLPSLDKRPHTLGPGSPSRIARKASKISLNIVSDVKAGSASLFGGIGRKSQQGQMLVDPDRERMERLEEMSIMSNKSPAIRGLGVDVGRGSSFNGWDNDGKEGGYRHRITSSHTQGIMKTTTSSNPGLQVQPSRSIMNPKMVDPKPSVRFTLDLPPKLDIDLNFSGLSLDKDLGRSREVGGKVKSMPGGWAERTAAAVLDKSRDIEVDFTCVEDYASKEGENKGGRRKRPPSVTELMEKGDPTTSSPGDSKEANEFSSKDEIATTEFEAPSIDRIPTLDPIEPGLTIYRLEDLANMGPRSPSDSSCRRESSVYGSVLSPPLSMRTRSSRSNSKDR